ncbi:hypothetical protein [Streptomyces sp. WAC 04229]|uniref:hypothetical protein n=1 Tax=Streptomyces sp. WAC 04229 TaxID=2203206 RepID=UPI00163C8659|nr:hypothetical protein [Streptomyces sp. WAC 04229]
MAPEKLPPAPAPSASGNQPGDAHNLPPASATAPDQLAATTTATPALPAPVDDAVGLR